MDKEDKLLKTAGASLIVLFAALALNPATAQENANDLTVDVNISEKTIIDIQPSSFAWGQGTDQVQPGTIASGSEEVNNYSRIQIENLGSVNITRVWFNTTYPNQRPFGTGDSSKYDSANFVALDSNQTDTDYNSFVNRKEYGLDQSGPGDGTDDIIYLDTPDNWDYGRFRDSKQEYFWTLDDTGADLSSATFRIGTEPHNETQTGATNLDDECAGGDESNPGNTDCNGYTLTQSGDWASTAVEVGAVDSTSLSPDGGKYYCAVMNSTQVTKTGSSESDRPEVFFVKWNTGFPGTSQGGCSYATNNTIGTGGQTDNLVPGEWITRNIKARVPYGVVSASLPTGNLYVLANSA